MKAQSTVYVKLQNLYKAKARKDALEVLETVRVTPGGENIDPVEVDLFCKNASFVKLVNSTADSQDLQRVLGNLSLSKPRPTVTDTNVNSGRERENDDLAEAIGTPLSLFPIYLALSATTHEPTTTAERITSSIAKTLPDAADDLRIVQAAEEVARAGGGELHNISALTGGMVAQETIKIITKQYIPIDNTCIFDGISSRCQVLRL